MTCCLLLYVGILDYMEGFTTENLHKVINMFTQSITYVFDYFHMHFFTWILVLQVYDVFCFLSRSTRSTQSNKESFGSSIANELFMIVRKQVKVNPIFSFPNYSF